MRHFATVVIGGGAAGIMAAGVAASRGGNVLLCERMEKPQRKVRITGKGRCNLTNLCSEEEFLAKVRCGADFFASALHRFNSEATMRFFEHIGVPLTVERGRRVFPSSGKAWDIADAHAGWCRTQGVTIETHARVTEITARTGQVTGIIYIRNRSGAIRNHYLRKCHSGHRRSFLPRYRFDRRLGYRLAHRLGHTIVPIRPSLTPLITGRPTPRPMADLTLRNISVLLLINGRSVAEEFGEMEFTPKGVSGPVVLRREPPGRRRPDRRGTGGVFARPEACTQPRTADRPPCPRNGRSSPQSLQPVRWRQNWCRGFRIGEWLKRAGIHPEEYARRSAHSNPAKSPDRSTEKVDDRHGGLCSVGRSDGPRAGGVSVDEIDPSAIAIKIGKRTLLRRRSTRYRCRHRRL